MKKKDRLSNIELLRIFAMLLILVSHFNMHGNFNGVQSNYIVNNVFVKYFVFGAIANNIYIIITGYFMISSNVNYKKIINLIIQMLFYSIIIPVILSIFGLTELNGFDVLKMLFPIFWGNWFCIYYILLFLFIPFINKVLNALDKKEFKKLVIIAIIIFSVIPMITGNIWGFSMLGLFEMDYIIGAYIRLYKDSEKNINYKKIRIITIIILAFLIISVIGIEYVGNKLNSNFILEKARYFITTNYSIFVIALAVCIFLLFKKLNIKNNKIINYISASTLGVYLIHENIYLRDFLWNKFLPNANYFNSAWFIFIALLKVCLIYICCIFIDKIRNKLFNKLELKIARKDLV